MTVASIAREFRDVLEADDGRNSANISLEYTSGLWIGDIYHGLLWQAKNRAEAESSTTQTYDAPSWSWSSLSTTVIWPKKRPHTRDVLRVLDVIPKEGDAHQYDETSYFSQVPRALLVKGYVAPVLIGKYFHNKQNGAVVHITGHSRASGMLENYARRYEFSRLYSILDPEISESWRIITSVEEPGIIAGYGSFERPEIQQQLVSYDRTLVYALHVSTVHDVGHGVDNSYAARVLGLGISVYNVIFVFKGAGVYSRLGVGCIFDQALQDCFKMAEEEEIMLV